MMSNLFKASLKVTNIVVLTSTKRNPAKGSKLQGGFPQGKPESPSLRLLGQTRNLKFDICSPFSRAIAMTQKRRIPCLATEEGGSRQYLGWKKKTEQPGWHYEFQQISSVQKPSFIPSYCLVNRKFHSIMTFLHTFGTIIPGNPW